MHATLLRMGGLRNIIYVLCFASVLAIVGPAPAVYAKDQVIVRSPALIQLTGAKDVSYDIFKDRERLTYSISEGYPASKSLDQIRSRLRVLGWTPLNDNYFMPGEPTSHVTGWQIFEDTSIDDEERVIVHAWSADWANTQGDIVLYGLKYSYPKDGKPDLSLLKVFAVYFPKRVAEALRQSPIGILPD